MYKRQVQHRFASAGELHGHAVGNLLIVALWELLGDTVSGLDWMGRLLGAQGRVLPMASVPLDLIADVMGIDPNAPDVVTRVRGQVAVASTSGQVVGISLHPASPPACPEAVEAVRTADWLVLGPGSWFTSVLPHLLVPALADALIHSSARRLVTLNLAAQTGETTGFATETYLQVLAAHAPGMKLDAVLVDPSTVGDQGGLRRIAASLGAEIVLAPVSMGDGTARHDPRLLAAAYHSIFADERGLTWR